MLVFIENDDGELIAFHNALVVTEEDGNLILDMPENTKIRVNTLNKKELILLIRDYADQGVIQIMRHWELYR